MTTKEKSKYRTTKKWKEFRLERIKDARNACQVCGIVKKGKATRYLQLHHLNPNAYGKETTDDVIVLCAGCHDVIERLVVRKQFDINTFLNAFAKVFLITKSSVMNSSR